MTPRAADALWSRHHAEWRDPAQVASQWQDAGAIDPETLAHRTSGAFWDVLADADITLLVTREYEHLVMALAAGESATFLPMPHPSGMAVDRNNGIVHVASTRNPNQVYSLRPVTEMMPRLDLKPALSRGRLNSKPLVPAGSRFYPGCLYMHDLALIGGTLHANAVGQNAVVRFDGDGRQERVWWPKCIERLRGPVFGRNHLQLNSIAAGPTLKQSYFSASTDRVGARRPGMRNFPVDKRGVIFSGRTREVYCRRLTRPHSARLHGGGVWVDNSGYGEFGFAEDGRFCPVVKLPGWTRGLCFHKGIAFVGTSRVIQRFRQYAPGLNVDASVCGVHAVEVKTGLVLGSLTWPAGNQIFAIDWIKRSAATGFPFAAGQRPTAKEKALFYCYMN
jgi:uncharacterized protein (TIGR03032 family)